MKLILALLVATGLTACGSDPNKEVTTKLTRFADGGFGLVMIADFTITNNTGHPVKDIEVKCTGYSETGTKIDQNTRTIYKVIQPGKTIKVSGFNMGYVASAVHRESCGTIKYTGA